MALELCQCHLHRQPLVAKPLPQSALPLMADRQRDKQKRTTRLSQKFFGGSGTHSTLATLVFVEMSRCAPICGHDLVNMTQETPHCRLLASGHHGEQCTCRYGMCNRPSSCEVLLGTTLLNVPDTLQKCFTTSKVVTAVCTAMQPSFRCTWRQHVTPACN